MSVYRPKHRDPKTGELSQSKIFWMDFRFKGMRIRESTGMPGITRAREVEDKRKQDLREGRAGIRPPDPPKLFSVAAAEWMDGQTEWSAAMHGIAKNSMNHLAPVFGKKLVTDIEAADVAKYQKARLAEGVSGRTVNIEVGCIRAVLDAGLWARIKKSKKNKNGVKMLPERNNVGRALTVDEETALLAECGNSRSRVLRPFVVLALETAARYGTIRRLQWRNVDFARRVLTFGKDKTAAGTGRVIPLMPRALETLKFWAQSFPDRQPDHYVFPSEKYGASGTGEVFGFTAGKVYETDPTKPTGSIKTAWERARGRAGLSGFRFHDCRHTGITRMIAARMPLSMIAKIVGWEDRTMVKMSARYGQFSTDDLRREMERVLAYPTNSPTNETNRPAEIQQSRTN